MVTPASLLNGGCSYLCTTPGTFCGQLPLKMRFWRNGWDAQLFLTICRGHPARVSTVHVFVYVTQHMLASECANNVLLCTVGACPFCAPPYSLVGAGSKTQPAPPSFPPNPTYLSLMYPHTHPLCPRRPGARSFEKRRRRRLQHRRQDRRSERQRWRLASEPVRGTGWFVDPSGVDKGRIERRWQ